ncbi:MAG: hypothetical protein RR135_02075 [Oscillospiraceae bacterium]
MARTIKKRTPCARVTIHFGFLAVISAAICLGGDMVLLLAAAVLHEVGHVIALRCCGGRIESLVAGVFGLRMTPYFDRAPSPDCTAAVALSGPAAGLLVAGISLALGFERFGAMNAALSVFNLLPIEGLDGATALRVAFIGWFGNETGERIYTLVGHFALIAMLAAGVRLLWSTHPMPTLLLASCYLLLTVLLRHDSEA